MPRKPNAGERSPCSRRRAKSSARGVVMMESREHSHRRERATDANEALAEKSKQRVRPDVRREHEEALLERGLGEAMTHRDESRVRGKILKGQRLEEPEDEDRRDRHCREPEPRPRRPEHRGARARSVGAGERRAVRRGVSRHGMGNGRRMRRAFRAIGRPQRARSAGVRVYLSNARRAGARSPGENDLSRVRARPKW